MNPNYMGLDRLRITNLIALCYVIDKFDKFDKDFTHLLSTKKSARANMKLERIAQGKLCLFAKEERKVYRQNQELINVLQKAGDFETFLWENYYQEGINSYKGLKAFAKYVNKNKSNINLIIGVLKKLQELGFEKIIFDEKLDFTKETYLMGTTLKDNLSIDYLDNLEAIPNYNPNLMKYKTNASSYRMTLAVMDNKLIPTSPFNMIALNSLLFSPDRLPKTLLEIDTFDKLITLSQTVSEEKKLIRESVDLNGSIDDLYNVYTYINNKVENMDSINSKDSLISLLNHIRNILITMDYLSKEHDKKIISKYPNITKERLEEEKQSYSRKRFK